MNKDLKGANLVCHTNQGRAFHLKEGLVQRPQHKIAPGMSEKDQHGGWCIGSRGSWWESGEGSQCKILKSWSDFSFKSQFG